MSTPIERAAKAVRASREFQAGAAFGIPSDAHEEAATAIARAVLESIDHKQLTAVVGHIWNPTFLAAGIKTHLTGTKR